MSAPEARPGTATDATRRAHVVVCGLEGLGLRVVEQLVAAGQEVVVVDDTAPARTHRAASALGATVVERDATEAGALEAAGLDTASAVVCAEPDDLRALRLALVVRERRDDVRVVTALATAAVGRAVAGGPGPDTVLDVAALATPTVVEACLQSPVHELDVGGHRFLSASTTAPRAGTLRTLYGDLVPLAVTPREAEHDDTATAVCPSRDRAVAPGDRVALLGTPAELAAAGIATDGPAPERRVTRRGGGWDPEARRAGHGRLRRGAAALVQLVREADRGLGWALVALLGLIVVSTVVLSLGYDDPGMSPVDALYFTVESVATVGFGDYSFAEQALWLRLWAVFLMLAGVVATAIPIAFFTDMLISRRLAETAGRRRASGARGHVVLIGLGAVGVAVLEALRERDREVVVVERDASNRFLDRARAAGAPVVFGDATDAGILRAARVPHAAAVAVVTSDDMANVETGLAVRETLGERWSAVPVVLRILDRELARTAADRFDFRFVRSVAELAAPWFVGGALGLAVLGTFPVHGRAFLLGRLTVAPGSGLDGLVLHELAARTRVVALHRAGSAVLEHPPRRDTRLAAGDEAFLVGPYSELLDVLRRHTGR
ncbi:NAD-binding protein [Actinomycetospora sp. C-140]